MRKHLLLGPAIWAMLLLGNGHAAEQVPEDTCHLELTLPAGATVAINGNDYGAERTLTFDSLEPGQSYGARILVTFADGEQEQRDVIIQGGRALRERFGPLTSLVEPAPPEPVSEDGKPEIVVQTGHARVPSRAALSPDGRHLATGGMLDSTIVLWDVATGHKLRSFERVLAEGEDALRGVECLAFSPNGELLFVGYGDNTIIVWEKTTGRVRRKFQTGDGEPEVFDRECDKVLVGSYNGVSLWDTVSGSEVRSLQKRGSNDRSFIQTGAFSPSGTYVAAGYFDGTTIVWNTATGAVVRTFVQDRIDPSEVSMESYARSFQAGGQGLSLETADSLKKTLLTPRVQALAFNPDETTLVTTASNGSVTLWNVQTGRRVRSLAVHSLGEMGSVAFSRDGRKLLCCSSQNATLWDVASGTRLRASTSPTLATAFSPDGTKMLTGHQDGTVSLRDIGDMKELWTVPAADMQVGTLTFSPNGKEFIAGSTMGRSAVLRSVADGQKLREFQVPPTMVNAPSYLRDAMRGQGLDLSDQGSLIAAVFVDEGRRLITGSLHMNMGEATLSNRANTQSVSPATSNTMLKLTAWEVATGQNVWDVDIDWSIVQQSGTFALSPDRRMLLFGDHAGTTIVDLNSGEKLRSLPGKAYSNLLQSVAFSPSGQSLLMCSDNSASLMNLDDLEEIRRFTGHQGMVNCLAFSLDGKRIVTGSADRTAILWDPATGERLHVLRGHKDTLLFVEFSPNGKYVLTSSKDDISILWDAESGAVLHSFPGSSGRDPGMLGSSGQAFAPYGSFTPDSRLVLTTGEMRGYKLWDAATGKNCYDSRGVSGGAIGAAIAPQGAPLVISRTTERELVVTDAESGNVLSSIRERSSELNALSVASNTNQSAVSLGGLHGGAVLWDAAFERNTRLAMGETFFTSPISNLTLSDDGRRIATASYVSGLTTWDAVSGKKLHTLDETAQHTRCLAFSPDGKYLITGLSEKGAVLWDAANGTKLQTLQTEKEVNSAAFSPDGRYLLTNGGERAAGLWDTSTGEKLQELVPGEWSWVNQVAFAPDGKQVATAGSHQIVIWNTADWQKTQTLRVEREPGHLAFGPDGDTIITAEAYRSGTVTMWSVSTGKKLQTYRGHTGGILSVTFRANGRLLVTGSQDGTVRLWEAATGNELARLIHLDGGRDWLAVTPDGLFDGSAGGRENVMFRFGGGLNVVSVDRFFQDFYYPGLLTAIINGERPKPDVQLAASVPPMVRVVQPQQGGPVDSSSVAVVVEATDQGGGIRGPWLRQAGARVDAASETVLEDSTIRRTFVIDLVEGENRLEFQAASADGSWESEPAVITFVCKESLPKPDLYLVAVGINDYPGDVMDMEYAVPDAQSMAGLFDERGRELYADVYITTLIDTQATSSAILKAIRDAGRQARPQDTVAAFLAGHGTVAQQQYYFVPGDFQRKADSLEEDVQTQALLASQINDVLGSAKALRRMLVFDTGQSGGNFGLTRTARNPFAFRGAVERLARSQGTFAIAAAAISDKAGEVEQLKHGVLTYSLLAGLHAVSEGPLTKQWIQPAGGDRVADVLEWFGFASARVPQLTRKYFEQAQDIQHCSAGTSFPVLPVPETTDVPSTQGTTHTERQTNERPSTITEGRGDSDLYVIAVGINRYTESSMNLQYAAGDAQALADLFRRRGTVPYRNVYVKEILDEQATRSGILTPLENVASHVRPQDTLVVFLGGHGKMVGQRYYFIPHDFRFEADSFEDDIRKQGLAADALSDAISQVSASKRLLILDTCASGGALGISRQGRDPFAFRGAIEKLGTSPGVFTIAASAAGEEAQEIGELGHGVLTYALLAGLRAVPPGGPLDNLAVQPAGPDARADVLEWFSYASGHVPRLTKRYLGQEQDVQTSGHGTSFLVLPVME